MTIARWMPGLAALRSYKASFLPHDLAAGVTLGAVLVPVGLAYGELAGLPMAGLYGSMLPLLGLFSVRQLAPGRGRPQFGDGGHRRGRRGAAGPGRSGSARDALRHVGRHGGRALHRRRPATPGLRRQFPVQAGDRGLHARRRPGDHRLAIAQGAGRPRRGRDHAGPVREPYRGSATPTWSRWRSVSRASPSS